MLLRLQHVATPSHRDWLVVRITKGSSARHQVHHPVEQNTQPAELDLRDLACGNSADGTSRQAKLSQGGGHISVLDSGQSRA